MREKELRLALVCYGGISLAVYMHGITKEIWRVVRASRASHEGDEPASAVDAVYHDLLDEMAARGGVRVRILADIIAGASAGGINGIFLGQALATGQSLDPLTDLWLEAADIESLIAPEAAPTSRFSKMWAMPIAWMAAGRSGEKLDLLDEETREEVRRKVGHLIRSRWFEPPFAADAFTARLLDAFDRMAAAPAGKRLLPPGQPLDLFVTVTDFTGQPQRLRLHSPGEVVETEHRMVVDFTDSGGGRLAAIPELVFAARATSSFPGAFPPFTVGELDRVLESRDQSWDSRDTFLRRVLPRHHAAGAADKAVLIDGSVLVNAPFRPAIDALGRRPARRQVDRRFVYIDPFPGMHFRLPGGGGHPGFFQTIIGAISELPRQQPIRDNLEAIAARSGRIDRMQAIVAAIREEVELEIEQLFGGTFFLDRPTAARLASWRVRAQAAAAAKAGFSYAAYGHLKVANVIDALTTLLSDAIGDEGPQRRIRLRAMVERMIAARSVEGDAISFTGGPSNGAKTFLRVFDLGYRIRRLRLLARRLTELEADHSEAELAPVRDAIYDSLADYLERQHGSADAIGADDLRNMPDDGAALLDRIAARFDLIRLDGEADARLAAAFAGLPRVARRTLLLTYLGFPYFDVATLPLLQGEGLDEFDPIKVDRIAPDDATAIRSGGAEATLKGIQFLTFGAFFSRSYRENDYLWGRLHGAERMIDIAISTLPPTIRLKPGRVAAFKRRAFLAILDEEEARLTAITPLIASLRQEIG
ncbi:MULTISPECIES: patatin-like protein [unclassified Sphingomonas]|uniref:patatin-like protein n=1 Tax=unclassified Sphingomonas TaxID=196159 RepID=UPI00285ECC1A|nr:MULTISPECIES: patatin-like protein [unclassified Sphingomonas]MDR6115930.1 patatin-related protein [Sphingomonas sp. SORGH_AS_0789]MDR6150399.1 patatin-related protein [Sphingomonas sp. SORGH_AS_0742]